MDTQTQKQKENEKKGGALGGLLGGAGSGAGGFGGLGTGSGGGLASLLARFGLRGGLLATKAGVVGLVMAGTTVAGGLGWVGYRVFGPSSSDQVGASYSLFSPRPKDAASASGSGSGAAGDQLAQGGGASSLDELKAANGGSASSNPDQAAADQAAAQKAAADKAAAQKAAAVAAAQAANKAAANKGNVMGNAAAKLKSNMQVGQLSKMPGGGVSGGSSASMAKAPGAAANSLAAFGSQKSPGAMARSSMARALGGGLGAGAQAVGANNEQSGPQYGGGASRVYDGAGSSPIGGAAGQSTGGGGAGTPSAGADSSNPTATSAGPSQFPTPPTPQGVDVTPWKTASELATALIAVAAMILMFGQKLYQKGAVVDQAMLYTLAAIVAVIGAAVIALGHTIASGTYGQTYQGGIFTAAGAFLIVGGAMMMLTGMKVGGAGSATMLHTITMLSGAAGLGMAIMAYMKPMATYDQSSFPSGVPDVYQAAPDNGLRYAVLGDLHGSDSRDS